MTPAFRPPALRPLALLFGLLALAWLAYAPGLQGGFLFDDLANLPALGAAGPVDDWPAFWRYLTSGTADPTGRPLSMLAFLLDARDWPADPAPFLRTNLLIHLANGALLFFLLKLLERAAGPAPHREATALLGAGLWLLHPLFVSTTLYVVQREAMLPATFMLAGLLAYVHGRLLLTHAPGRALWWMGGGIVAGTALAFLSKPNGALLPLLVLVLEATVLRHGGGIAQPDPRAARRAWVLQALLLALPSAVVLLWLLSLLPDMAEPLPHRGWSIAQRLLTEPRVLLDYLRLLVVPRPLSPGLFNEGFAASTGWWQPVSTLPALLLVAALAASGVVLRRRAPAWAAAILFFLAGHLLESSVVPLELYFEHRNYLPAMLLFWPLARALARWRVPAATRVGLGAALLVGLALVTWQRSMLWGQPALMAELWARQHPESPRALATAAMRDITAGRGAQAMTQLDAAWRRAPHELQYALNVVDAACATGGLRAGTADAVAGAFRHFEQGEPLATAWLDHALDRAVAGQCRGMGVDTIEAWHAAAAANPRLQRAVYRQELAAISGRIALHRGRPDAAAALFAEALALAPTPSAAAAYAALLGGHGHPRQALALLDAGETSAHAVPARGWNMPRLHRWILDRQRYWPSEIERLRAQLRADLAQDAPARAATEAAGR